MGKGKDDDTDPEVTSQETNSNSPPTATTTTDENNVGTKEKRSTKILPFFARKPSQADGYIYF